MKILHCIPNMAGGGAERQLTYLCDSFIREGLEVHVALCGGGYNMKRLEDSGVNIHKLTSRGNHDIGILWQLIKLIKQIDPDIIQTWLRQMDVFGGLAALITRTPFVLSERNSGRAYSWNWKYFLRVCIGRKADAIISNSYDGKGYWDRRTGRKVKKKIIRNIVPIRAIEIAKTNNTKANIYPGKKVILAASRLKPQKNLFTLLRALQIVFTKSDDTVALLFGEGPLQKKLLKFQQKLNIQERLKIMGYTSRLYDWLTRADVFVSVSYFEGNPHTVLEAIACKCPVVVSDVPAHREILDDSSAFFAATLSPDDIAKKIVQALSEGARVKRRLAAAYKNISGQFREAITRQYLEVYEEIIKSR